MIYAGIATVKTSMDLAQNIGEYEQTLVTSRCGSVLRKLIIFMLIK